MPTECDGDECRLYNGRCSFLPGFVYCGYTHKRENASLCPRKQSILEDWSETHGGEE